PFHFDEPFADSSQVATMLVARHARKKVVVSLSGDGGDELFAGYHRHFWAARLSGALERVPLPLRDGAAAALRQVPAPVWAGLGEVMGKKSLIFAEKARKLIRVLPSRGPSDLYLGLVSHDQDPCGLVL